MRAHLAGLGLTLLMLTSCTRPSTEPVSMALAGPEAPTTEGLLGVWSLRLHGDASGTPRVTLEPPRAGAALGDAFALDATRYFQGALCGDCLQISGVALTSELDLAIDLRLRHPFPMPLAPPQPTVRLDLHLFDVAGMLVGGTPGATFPGLLIETARPVLLNPDGYSGAFDAPLERLLPTPGITVHPYRLFTTDPSAGNYAAANPNGFADLFAPTGYNVFPQGAGAEQTFLVRLPADPRALDFETEFLFAVTAHWAQPSNNQRGTELLQRANPVYFLPESNAKAAWQVLASVSDNTLQEAEPTSSASLSIQVSDWQFGALVDPLFPDPARKEQLRAASEPSQLRIEVPGLTPTPLEIDPASGTGAWPAFTYTATLTNEAGAPAGDYLGAVAVLDGRAEALGIAQDDPLPFPLGTLATYALFELAVAPRAGTGGFGPSEVVSELEPWDTSGHDNHNAPDLIAHGQDLYLAYQGSNGFGVVARKLGPDGIWESNKVYQGSPDAWVDPTVGFDPDNDQLHCLMSGIGGIGQTDARSFDQGASWEPRLTVYSGSDSGDWGQTLTNGGTGMPVALFQTYHDESGAQLIDAARFNGAAWLQCNSPSALKALPGDFLFRLDYYPQVFRFASGTVIATFATNERFIAIDGIDYGFEPVSARSTDDGATWQNWTYVHPFLNNQQTEQLSSALGGGDTLYVLESLGSYEFALFKTVNEGLAWVTVPLPITPVAVMGEAEVAAGPGDQVAVVYVGEDASLMPQLYALKSTTAGGSWSAPLPCDDDPDNLFSVYNCSPAYTADGRLHVAFADDRTFPWLWRVVSEE